MAAVVLPLGGAGGMSCSLTYDDQSALITALTMSNQTQAPHLMTVFVLNPNDPTQILAARSFNEPPGAIDARDISGFGIHMVNRTAKDGSTYLGLPAPVGCGATS
jgi:hypothetical protein